MRSFIPVQTLSLRVLLFHIDVIANESMNADLVGFWSLYLRTKIARYALIDC